MAVWGSGLLAAASGEPDVVWQFDRRWDPTPLTRDERNGIGRQLNRSLDATLNRLAEGPVPTAVATFKSGVLALGTPLDQALSACTTTSVMRPEACGAALPSAVVAGFGVYSVGESMVAWGDAAWTLPGPRAMRPAYAGGGSGMAATGDTLEADADELANSLYAEARATKPPPGSGDYADVKGHHIHSKAGMRGHVSYDPDKGFSISQDFMKDRGWIHEDMTAMQQKLFRELAASGRPNLLAEHTRIAIEALKAGGATSAEAKRLVEWSLKNLEQQGVAAPTRVPWQK